MEFYGTKNAPISLTRAVPWNSMELRMRQFRWHEQFHGIPWNFGGANFADTSSSMEFHGTWSAPISLTWEVPWNSMELWVRQFRWHEQFHEQFHGIPWNLECANFADTSSSMEFHGTRSAPISLTRAVPWNSMEFHGTWSAPISLIWEVPWNSMEFHGTLGAPISLTRAVPWNSMEFHGTWSAPISLIWEVPWNSMEFHGTLGAPISLTRAVLWNSMELWVRQFRWHEQFHGIPWNLECANFDDTSHGIPWNSMELEVRQFRWHEKFHGIPWNSMELWVRQFRWHEQFHGIPWN